MTISQLWLFLANGALYLTITPFYFITITIFRIITIYHDCGLFLIIAALFLTSHIIMTFYFTAVTILQLLLYFRLWLYLTIATLFPTVMNFYFRILTLYFRLWWYLTTVTSFFTIMTFFTIITLFFRILLYLTTGALYLTIMTLSHNCHFLFRITTHSRYFISCHFHFIFHIVTSYLTVLNFCVAYNYIWHFLLWDGHVSILLCCWRI